MKTLLFTFIITVLGFSSINAQAPSYTDFEFDVLRVGFAIPEGGNHIQGGVSFGGEIRYNLTDNFSIGFGSDYNIFGSKTDAIDAGLTDTYAFVGDYYLKSNSPYRAFVGMGVGYSSEGDIISGNNNTVLIQGASGTILTPRVGYEFDHLRLMGSYNIGLKDELSNFFSLSVAITLWGGFQG